MTRIAAVILMGGDGTRLGGVDKAGLDIGGMTCLTRVLAAISDANPVLLATGAPRQVQGQRTVPDLPGAAGGPLAGIAAAIDALAAEPPDWLLSVAVDTPFFPADFLIRALPLMPGVDVVLSAYAGQDYPTNAFWRMAAIGDLPAQLRAGSGPRGPRHLAASLRAARLDYAALTDANPFANANTPQDLANLRARAALHRQR